MHPPKAKKPNNNNQRHHGRQINHHEPSATPNVDSELLAKTIDTHTELPMGIVAGFIERKMATYKETGLSTPKRSRLT